MEENIKKLTIEKYWLKRLSGDLPGFSLALLPLSEKEKSNKKSAASRQMESYFFEIPRHTAEKLTEISAGSDKALFILFLSGLNILLYQYTGVKDLVIGTVPPRKEETKAKILFCRNQITGNSSFKEILHQTRQVVLEAFNYSDYSFGTLYQKLLAQSKTGHLDIFNVAFVYESLQDRSRSLNQFDLVFLLSRQEDRLILQVEYITDIYGEEILRRFCFNLVYIFDQVTKKPDQPIAGIDRVCPAEAREILAFNDTAGEYPRETLHRLFEKQAEKEPDHIALVGPLSKKNRTYRSHMAYISYKELNEQARQLACFLQEKGVQPDTVVAIKVKPSIEMIIGIMGVLKAGAAYLPIDPDYPPERIDYMLKDSGAKVMVTVPGLSEKSEKLSIINYQLSIVNEIPPKRSINNYQLTINNSQLNLAYILYTSGSTGRPKGVMIRHCNVVAYLNAFAREFEVTPADIVIQQASYSFDVFVEEVYPALFNGAKILIAQKHEILDIPLLAEIILRHRVTMISCSPLLLNELNKLGGVKTIRTYISGGDVLKAEYIGNLLKSAAVYNTYGPTETTVCATYHRCLPPPAAQHQIPIGKPITNYRLYILDNHKKLLPVGVPGEIYISGPGLARGYLNNPELTAERFCLRRPGGALFEKTAPPGPPRKNFLLSYRSGDLARWLPDGNIQFLGRIDTQVKIRGFRIEVGEIENCLREHEQVGDAIVTHRIDKNNEAYLCAYIVAGFFSPSRLRSFLAKKLPDYMVPAHFVKLKQIPINSHGKIDMKLLPEPEINPGAIPFISGDLSERTAVESKKREGAAPAPGAPGCYIIGETTLPVKCAEILLEHGYRILGIISNDPLLIDWAKSTGIPTIPARKNRLITVLKQNPFDYLFGIFNTLVLPGEILSLPRKGVINYHDSLLPRYAGMHVPSWAIINRETRHGITWHVVDKGIDTGDILKQVPIEIAPNDTGFSLNMKCYHAGVKGFEELVRELANGRETPVRQDFDQRTYFGKYKRPAAGGMISFNRAAEDIDVLVRALNFAGYENPLGTAKIAVENEFFIIPGISVLHSTGRPPGSVLHIGKESLSVSTKTRDIEIRKILAIDGQEMTTADFVKKFSLVRGWCFEEMDRERAEDIDKYNTIICRHENFWKRRLSRLQPLHFVTGIPGNPGDGRRFFSRRRISLPGQMPGDFLLAVFAAYLSQLTGILSFDIAYSDSSLQQDVKDLQGLFAGQVPFRVEWDGGQTFDTFCQLIKKELCRIRKHHTYIRDIFTRYPELQGKAEPAFPLGMMLVNNPGDFEPDSTQQLCLVAAPGGKECMFFYDAMVLDQASIDALAQDFYIFLEKVLANMHTVITRPTSRPQHIKIKARIHRPVKINGTVIDSGEIEQYLAEHRDIKQAAVVSKPDKKGGRRLVAYLVSEIELKEPDLRTYLSENLLFPLPPIHYLQLEKMPLTGGNGNSYVHRELLENLDIEISDWQESSPPRDEIQLKLAEIWSEVLGVDKERISINDDFFELGGHSLKATVLVLKIHKAFNVKVPITILFENPTISAAARYIAGAKQHLYTAITKAEKKEYYPLSAAQERLYIAQQMDPAGIGYNVQVVVRLEGEILCQNLIRVFRRLIARHEILRTSFEIVGKKAVQRVHPPGDVSFEIQYYKTGVINNDVPPEGEDIIHGFDTPFDLSEAPLLRVGLMELNRQTHFLMVVMHHVAADCISMSLFFKEFALLYRGETLAPVNLQYKDFSIWQKDIQPNRETQESLKRQEAFWLEELAGGIPILELPYDYPRPAVLRSEGSLVRFRLDNRQTRKLEQMAAEEEVALSMAVSAVFILVLAKISGQEDILVGIPASGRGHPDLEQVFGFFVNMLVLRNRVHHHKTFSQFLNQVKNNTVNAYNNQDYPFDLLAQQVQEQRDPGRNALFDVVFVWQNPESQWQAVPGGEDQAIFIGEKNHLKAIPCCYGLNKAPYDLIFSGVASGETLEFFVIYNTTLFKQETILKMNRNFKEILSEVLADRGVKLEDLHITSDLLAAASPGFIEDRGEFGF